MRPIIVAAGLLLLPTAAAAQERVTTCIEVRFDPAEVQPAELLDVAAFRRALRDGSIRLVSVPGCAAAPSADAADSPAPQATSRPTSRPSESRLPQTVTPKPTELPPAPLISLSGPASPDFEPTERSVIVEPGAYELRWRVDQPFPDPLICGVTISLFDDEGNYAAGVAGVSTVVPGPDAGLVAYPVLAAGEYLLFIYVGCPWSLELIEVSTAPTATPSPTLAPQPLPTSMSEVSPFPSPELAIVGDYSCLSLGDARAQIETVGLNVGMLFPDDPPPEDSWLVHGQLPASGESVPVGSAVDLQLDDPVEPCPST